MATRCKTSIDPSLPEGWEVQTKFYPSKQNHPVKEWLAPNGRKFRSWSSVQQFLQGQQDAMCEWCGGGEDEANNEILLCDGRNCNRAHHQKCLPTPLLEVPAGDWLCPACESGEGPRQKKRRLGSDAHAAAASSAPPAPIKLAAHYFESHRTPGCVVWGCDGAGQLASGGDAQYMLSCDTCGTRWQSTWWWEQLHDSAAASEPAA